MTTTYHFKYQPMTGTCDRCGREGIPDDELFLAVRWDDRLGSMWVGVCESCDDGDGSLRFHGRTLAELRAETAFGSWMLGKSTVHPWIPV